MKLYVKRLRVDERGGQFSRYEPVEEIEYFEHNDLVDKLACVIDADLHVVYEPVGYNEIEVMDPHSVNDYYAGYVDAHDAALGINAYLLWHIVGEETALALLRAAGITPRTADNVLREK